MTIAAETHENETGRATCDWRCITHRGIVVASARSMLLAFVIRARGIGATNLWLDEANSWLLTTYSVRRHAGQYPSQSVEPALFLLLKTVDAGVGRLGNVAFRSFSLLVSLLLLPLVYRIGRETVGRGRLRSSRLLLALSPLQLYFAQEARVYMLATLLADAGDGRDTSSGGAMPCGRLSGPGTAPLPHTGRLVVYVAERGRLSVYAAPCGAPVCRCSRSMRCS